jgi:predicted transcriptional regulator of viral defense system
MGYTAPMERKAPGGTAGGTIRARDVEHVGLTRGRLRGMLRRGEIHRAGRGIYRPLAEATERDTVAAICARVPGAIICLLTALAIHRIGTQLPADVWIALDRKARKPRITDLPVRLVRYSGAMLTYGVDGVVIQGVPARITSPARTVVDCFRYRNKIGIDVALEALKESLRTRRATVDAIIRASQVCRVSSVMAPYLQAVVA